MKSLEQKSCSSCGESFTCGRTPGEDTCWCDRLPHVSLGSNEDRDCLCPQCLSEAIQKLDLAGSSAGERVHTAIKTGVDPQRSLVEGEDYYSEGATIRLYRDAIICAAATVARTLAAIVLMRRCDE